jgi:hypothetical protein
MRLYNVNGRLVNKNVSSYVINWDGKSRSNIQFQVKQFLKPYWHNMIMYEEFPVYGSLLKVDLLNATLKIAIEVHGPQHEQLHFFHNGKKANFIASIKNDFKKQDWLEKNNFQLVEIYDYEISSICCDFFKNKFNITL